MIHVTLLGQVAEPTRLVVAGDVVFRYNVDLVVYPVVPLCGGQSKPLDVEVELESVKRSWAKKLGLLRG